MTLKLVEDFAVTQLRNDHRDALQLDGEQVIVLALHHAVSSPDAEKCPDCHDDVYEEGEAACVNCYGTGFAHPVREAAKVWALFTDTVETETLHKHGITEPTAREMQIEAFPQLMQRDVVVRVSRWTADGRVAEIEGFYTVQAVTNNSLRTGARYGQQNADVIGQKALVTMLNRSHAITNYPVLGKSFTDPIIAPVGSLATPPVTRPDTKVVYVPVLPTAPDGAPLTPAPAGVIWRQVFFYKQNFPASVWTIKHPFDYNPSVTLFVGGEEADTDVEFPDEHTAVLTFATPQAGTAQLI